MDHNIVQFKKSKYIERSVHEMIDNCVSLIKQVKKNPVENLKTPLPKIQEAPSMMISQDGN